MPTKRILVCKIELYCSFNEREVKLSVPYHFITAALIPSLIANI